MPLFVFTRKHGERVYTMARYYIEGGARLNGELKIHGAKNAVLPILAGTFLMEDCSIHNCPALTDVTAACNILRHLGCKVEHGGGSVTTKADNSQSYEIPDDLMREMRSSVVFLGAIVARCGRARVSLPGGCEL